MMRKLFGRPDESGSDLELLTQVEAAGDVMISPDVTKSNRIPPGQTRTFKWPVLHAGGVPRIDLEKWDLTIGGLVGQPLRFSYQEFLALPTVKVFSDFHCVTRWSRLNNLWEGVSTRLITERAAPTAEVKFVFVHAEEGWTTNMPLSEFLADDALFAYKHDEKSLPADHGGPVRLVIPRLYAWKSAKWIRGVEFRATDTPGFWEQGGYHMHGDPWTEERFYWS
jgi:DMSO/TMAO reductase YedYZ molybdopterin-dependent catalytic subunit